MITTVVRLRETKRSAATVDWCWKPAGDRKCRSDVGDGTFWEIKTVEVRVERHGNVFELGHADVVVWRKVYLRDILKNDLRRKNYESKF